MLLLALWSLVVRMLTSQWRCRLRLLDPARTLAQFLSLVCLPLPLLV
jgi:hypothetical protein